MKIWILFLYTRITFFYFHQKIYFSYVHLKCEFFPRYADLESFCMLFYHENEHNVTYVYNCKYLAHIAALSLLNILGSHIYTIHRQQYVLLHWYTHTTCFLIARPTFIFMVLTKERAHLAQFEEAICIDRNWALVKCFFSV